MKLTEHTETKTPLQIFKDINIGKHRNSLYNIRNLNTIRKVSPESVIRQSYACSLLNAATSVRNVNESMKKHSPVHNSSDRRAPRLSFKGLGTSVIRQDPINVGFCVEQRGSASLLPSSGVRVVGGLGGRRRERRRRVAASARHHWTARHRRVSVEPAGFE